ncbi:MAG: hypothetical protein ABIJ08_01275 [Nanoarchaeota archaeon]
MGEDIFDQIIEKLDITLKDLKSYDISKDNFYEINDVESDAKIVFIDGGNSEILSAANFSLQLIRVYYTIYQNNERIKADKKEFYVLINSLGLGDKIDFKTEIFPINYSFSSFSFDSMDKNLRQGNNRIKVSKIGEVIRKLAEIKVAEDVVDELNKGDVIVRDGDLDIKLIHEKEFYGRLFQKSSEKGVVICGLSKTSDLFTIKGNSLLIELRENSPYGEWYHLDGGQYVVKLNKNADYVFRFDVYGTDNVDYVLGLLKNNSMDPVFLGYPYGLIEADRLGRVTNNEIDALKIQFIAKAGDKWEKIRKYLATNDAHTILDKIS